MTQQVLPIISILLGIPLLGAAVLALLPREREGLIKVVALVTTLAALAVSIPLGLGFQAGATGFPV